MIGEFLIVRSVSVTTIISHDADSHFTLPSVLPFPRFLRRPSLPPRSQTTIRARPRARQIRRPCRRPIRRRLCSPRSSFPMKWWRNFSHASRMFRIPPRSPSMSRTASTSRRPIASTAGSRTTAATPGPRMTTSSHRPAERLEMYKKYAENKPLSYFTKYSEKIRVLEDRDGDGKADFAQIFADGFNDPLDGTAAGVMALGWENLFCLHPACLAAGGHGRGSRRRQARVTPGRLRNQRQPQRTRSQRLRARLRTTGSISPSATAATI